MREYQIKMEPFQFIALRKLEIRNSVNEHASAEIAVCIRDEWKAPYLETLMEGTWVKIIGAGEEGDGGAAVHTVLFHGPVTDFSFSGDGYETVLQMSLASGTVLMDTEPHFRVFQNENTPCPAIHQKIAGCYKEGQAVCMEGKDARTGGVLVQYRETDWAFLKRLAGRNGSYLVPDVSDRGCRYTVGLPEGIRQTVPEDRISVRFDRTEHLKKTQGGMLQLQPEDLMELVFTEREIFRLGDSISHQGAVYYLWKSETVYDGEECVHTYHFRTKPAIAVTAIPHKEAAGCSFAATVSGVQKDRVQVTVAQDEWGAQDGKKWFPYATVYSSADGTGWYCMPETGDSVRLYVPEKEEDSFVLSAVHKETDQARQNPDHKSFKTKYGKEILFTPQSILVTNNKGMMVMLDDSEGITINSDRDIVIEAQDSLTISSAQESLLIAADDVLQVKQGGTSMTLSGDISFTGGEFRIQ